VFEVTQFVTMHPVFKSFSLVLCDNSVVSHLSAILCITHTYIYCPLNINQRFDQQIQLTHILSYYIFYYKHVTC